MSRFCEFVVDFWVNLCYNGDVFGIFPSNPSQFVWLGEIFVKKLVKTSINTLHVGIVNGAHAFEGAVDAKRSNLR